MQSLWKARLDLAWLKAKIKRVQNVPECLRQNLFLNREVPHNHFIVKPHNVNWKMELFDNSETSQFSHLNQI